MSDQSPKQPIKGRGAASQLAGRFDTRTVESESDGWDIPDQEEFAATRLETEISEESARSIITYNQSPDVGFSRSINPYRGCEHGCVYCFARPTHSYLGLSPGLDFESRLIAKTNAPALLRKELAKSGYQAEPIALGINTDAYQPVEKTLLLSRQLLEVLAEARHPTIIVTKSALVLRDLDLLNEMARQRLARVYLSVTTLDNRLSARLEPRAAAPHARLKTIERLAQSGVEVGVLLAPVIPTLNDAEIERILKQVREAGAGNVGYVLLRLPNELKALWREWLELHYPDRARHAISLIQQMHHGKDYNPSFGIRMRGSGPFADLIEQRFQRAYRELGFQPFDDMECSLFTPPRLPSAQGDLFDPPA
ncbi:PA0069 family radical SAM protein [Pseudomarimonas arenosa]|uniref:PA0069 family radical SAM protein n=1 Tax=Pseudomarimonas arenosa TaxID=2774145 RepID=A0AAW3ZNR7_9GAMM|nr:PA0069 family radical SAM protein [Pseudomarimonas arenosa]MBD8526727.1 PA0069 family radical SAM protein [Pseudomarimonas arenosa]